MNAPVDVAYGELLKSAREAENQSQAAVAREVGVSSAYISMLESTPSRRPSRELHELLTQMLPVLGETVPMSLVRSLDPTRKPQISASAPPGGSSPPLDDSSLLDIRSADRESKPAPPPPSPLPDYPGDGQQVLRALRRLARRGLAEPVSSLVQILAHDLDDDEVGLLHELTAGNRLGIAALLQHLTDAEEELDSEALERILDELSDLRAVGLSLGDLAEIAQIWKRWPAELRDQALNLASFLSDLRNQQDWSDDHLQSVLRTAGTLTTEAADAVSIPRVNSLLTGQTAHVWPTSVGVDPEGSLWLNPSGAAIHGRDDSDPRVHRAADSSLWVSTIHLADDAIKARDPEVHTLRVVHAWRLPDEIPDTQSYADVVIEVDVPGTGEVLLKPTGGDRPGDGFPDGVGAIHLLTAHNNEGRILPASVNDKQQERLTEIARAAFGADAVRLATVWPSDAWSAVENAQPRQTGHSTTMRLIEPHIAVFSQTQRAKADIHEVARLADDFGQISWYRWTSDELRVVTSTDARESAGTWELLSSG